MASAGVSLPEELAEDYKSSLEDLTFNSRWEITNLTVIAKENIHAAQAISKVVEEHIQKVSLSLYIDSSSSKVVFKTMYCLYLYSDYCKEIYDMEYIY